MFTMTDFFCLIQKSVLGIKQKAVMFFRKLISCTMSQNVLSVCVCLHKDSGHVLCVPTAATHGIATRLSQSVRVWVA